jgi:CheY-like chemotaxis protein
MDFDQIIKLLEAIAPLIQVLIWPFIIVFLWRAFKIYVEDLRKDKNVSEMGIDVSATGLKFNFKKQVEVATMLVQADAAKQMENAQGTRPTASRAQTDAIVNAVSRATNPVIAQRIAGAKLLWVDDRPENNIYPRRAMEAVGIQITLCKSTEDALEKVHSHTYDVIISDMGRQSPDPQAPYDNRAGYTLLDKLRDQHNFTPFIIYAGSSSPEHQAETKRHGGFGTTHNPQVLFQMVIDAIQQE